MGKPFREGLFKWPLQEGEEFRLKGSRCRKCQKSFFPARSICPFCYQEESLEDLRLSSRGKLETYTVVRQAGPRYPVPYLVGYVALPEGMRVFSQLAECRPEDLAIGMEMEIIPQELRKDENGEPLTGYKFRPVKPQGVRGEKR